MNRTTLLQERRMQSFQDVLGYWQARRLSALEAAELLGMSERSFHRYRQRYEEEGPDGLFDRRLGKASARRVPADQVAWVLDEYRSHVTGAGRSSTSTTICANATASPGATPGPRPSCSAQAWSPGRPGVAPIVAAGRASPASA